MTARRDPDSFLRAFLEDGPSELPDRSYDAVRTEIDHTRQRVVFGPWRLPTMTNFARYGIAAAAIVVVAVVGFNLLPKQAPPAVPGATPTTVPTAPPTIAPTASPTSAPTSTPIAAIAITEGPLAPGTYYADESRVNNVARLTFTVPAGWSAGAPLPPQGSLNLHPPLLHKDQIAAGRLWLETWIVDATYVDVCQWRGTDTPVGPTASDLVAALAAQTGRDASAPSDVTLGGFPAKRIETVTPGADVAFCNGGLFNYWPGVGPNTELTGRGTDLSNQTDVVYAADVAGNRLVLVASHLPGTSQQDLAELDAIIASIQIDP
jgi:hypothetical protein